MSDATVENQPVPCEGVVWPGSRYDPPEPCPNEAAPGDSVCEFCDPEAAQ